MEPSKENITLLLKDIDKAKKALGEVKKSMRDAEKVETDDYIQLKNAIKDMRATMKEQSDTHYKHLLEDEEYISWREMKVKQEEELGLLRTKLSKLATDIPDHDMELIFETDTGPVKAQFYHQVHLALNGKNEKL